MGDTVSIRIKIDDNGSFRTVEADAKEVASAINSVVTSASHLKANFVNLASVSRAVFTGMICGMQEAITKNAKPNGTRDE